MADEKKVNTLWIKPVPKRNFRAVVPKRDAKKIHEYQEQMKLCVDEMEKSAPYRSLVGSSRTLIRGKKEVLHSLLDGASQTPELPTPFGWMKFHLDKPFPSSNRSITEEALGRLDLDEMMKERYDEIETVVRRGQRVECQTKLFMIRPQILEAKEEIVKLHRAGFHDRIMECKTPELERFYTTEIIELAWHMYVITQFKEEAAAYNHHYNKLRNLAKAMADDRTTQMRYFAYKDLDTHYLPWESFSKSVGYNSVVRSTLAELSAETDEGLLELFDHHIVDVTHERKQEVKDMWLRFYLDNVEYTLDEPPVDEPRMSTRTTASGGAGGAGV